jgi:hypothetical protein
VISAVTGQPVGNIINQPGIFRETDIVEGNVVVVTQDGGNTRAGIINSTNGLVVGEWTQSGNFSEANVVGSNVAIVTQDLSIVRVDVINSTGYQVGLEQTQSGTFNETNVVGDKDVVVTQDGGLVRVGVIDTTTGGSVGATQIQSGEFRNKSTVGDTVVIVTQDGDFVRSSAINTTIGQRVGSIVNQPGFFEEENVVGEYVVVATLALVPYSPVARFTENPEKPYAGQPVYFNASTSLPGFDGYVECPITEYDWDFGDGHLGTGITVTHVYDQPGNYLVTLTVYAPGIPPYIDPRYTGTNTTGTTQQIKQVLPVGGYAVPIDVIPVDKPATLLALYLGLASTILAVTAATTIYVKHRKKKQ